MSSIDSVSIWLDQLKTSDQDAAAQNLWERYFERLIEVAHKKLRNRPPGGADKEDVALSAFDSFCRGAKQGRFPRLADRNNLWQLLVVITERKAADLVKHEHRQKRGGGKIVEASPSDTDSAGWNSPLDQVPAREPSPEFAVQAAEELRSLLDRLGDEDLRQIALWKLEGYSNEEIAAKRECVLRTVERKLQLIRTLWNQVEGAP